MIVSLTRYTTRLAVRVKNLLDGGQLMRWQELQLVIAPGEDERCACHEGGSPWILCGCWPFHPTGVDVANPSPHDFPAITLDAFETDDEGRVVFALDQRFHRLPNGRYTGILRVHPHTPPINLMPRPAEPASPEHLPVPPGYGVGLGSEVHYDKCGKKPCGPLCAPPPPPMPHACILARFDIDLGPECAQHMIDQCALEFKRNDCGEEV